MRSASRAHNDHAAIGIMMLDTVFPRIYGDIGNAETFSFPVLYKVVKGASVKRVVFDADPRLFQPFIHAAQELVEQGASAISTSCGFLAIFHRELVNVLDQAIVAETGNSVLFPKHLPDRIRIKIARASLNNDPSRDVAPPEGAIPSEPFPKLKALRDARIAELEHQYLKDLMRRTKGDVKEACRISGLKRARLYELMKKYNVNRYRLR